MSESPSWSGPKKKRPRRRHCELVCHYACNFGTCRKAYGTLSHLNVHVVTQNHGSKRKGEEFKEIRLMLRRQRLESKRMMRENRFKRSGETAVGSENEDDNPDEDSVSSFSGSTPSLVLDDVEPTTLPPEQYYTLSPEQYNNEARAPGTDSFDWATGLKAESYISEVQSYQHQDYVPQSQSLVQLQLSLNNFNLFNMGHGASSFKQDLKNFDYVLPNVHLTRFTS
ncbi:unnamed protein product [Kuraishia capsulata CBS 1993]|uniref:C2H2-type domain-containing protein n=1 Tax=Kuraishia capsulata CBS 1993 TaxID=1382522 RepID=W6MH13_9ASCO|nr:uncharacterized protein KUCA_T00000890001 [Kuraishia capsulata CBS 1993]CDK24923.1 unnamed protein product [Kuraishia capsulata CBS 1993]